MTLANPINEKGLLADGNGNPIVAAQQTTIVELTDSTTGTAGDILNDTTANTKDDLASIAAKINGILQVLAAHGLIADA